jgi:hypothetical protein
VDGFQVFQPALRETDGRQRGLERGKRHFSSSGESGAPPIGTSSCCPC